MSDTTFVDYDTASSNLIVAAWLNVINNAVYRGANPVYVTSTGSANAQVITLPATSLYIAKAAGDRFWFKVGAGLTNSGATTLTVTGGISTGATAVQLNGAALVGGELTAGQLVEVMYDGTAWQILQRLAASTFVQTLLQLTTAALFRTALSTVADPGANGMMARTSAGVTAARTLTSANTNLSIADGNGVSANPTITLANASTSARGAVELATQAEVDLATADRVPTTDLQNCSSIAEVATTSGTAVTIASGLPSGINQVQLALFGISGSGTSDFILQLGTLSGGFISAGYVSTAGSRTAETDSTAGFILRQGTVAADAYYGLITLTRIGGTNKWVCSGVNNSTAVPNFFSGGVDLGAVLTQIRITTAGGADTFDAGSIGGHYLR